MNTNYIENWSTQWSEHTAPYHGIYDLKEPMNGFSAMLMCIYVIRNLCIKLKHYWNKRKIYHSIKNQIKTHTIVQTNKHKKLTRKFKFNTFKCVMKVLLAFNLTTSTIAHLTYYPMAITLDSGSILLMMNLYLYRESRTSECMYITMLYIYNPTLSYLTAYITIYNVMQKKILVEKRKVQSNRYAILLSIAMIIWILDQVYVEYWYLYGHAIFHVISTYSVDKLMNIYC